MPQPFGVPTITPSLPSMPQYAPRPQTSNAIQLGNIQDDSHVDKLGNQLSELNVGSNPAGQDTFDQRQEVHNPSPFEVGLF